VLKEGATLRDACSIGPRRGRLCRPHPESEEDRQDRVLSGRAEPERRTFEASRSAATGRRAWRGRRRVPVARLSSRLARDCPRWCATS